MSGNGAGATRTLAILSGMVGALLGSVGTAVTAHFTLGKDLASVRTDVALIRRDMQHTRYPWNDPVNVAWRVGVDQHLHSPGIHQTPAEKAALIREVIGAVFDERGRREREGQ